MRVADVGGEEFDVAPAGGVAGVGDQRRHYIGVGRRGERAGLDYGGQLIAHPRGRTMLPGGTPPMLKVRWNSAASASRSVPRRTAHDAPLFFPRAAGGQVPWAVIGHRTLDGEQPGVEVGDDQEERLGRVGVEHAPFYHESP